MDNFDDFGSSQLDPDGDGDGAMGMCLFSMKMKRISEAEVNHLATAGAVLCWWVLEHHC